MAVPSIAERERAERQLHIDNAVASVRLEGLEPSRSALAVFERYVNGELSIEEMGAEVQALNAREFGPVPVPGN